MPGLDGFTAGLSLELLRTASASGEESEFNDAVDLINMIKEDGGPISDEDRKFAEDHAGEPCEVTGVKGTVVGPNNADKGIYPGDRYPIVVLVEKEEGGVYEYDRTQLKFRAKSKEDVFLYARGYLTAEEHNIFMQYSEKYDLSRDIIEKEAVDECIEDLLDYPDIRDKADKALVLRLR